MDLKTLKKILERLIDEKILTSRLINIVSTVYEEDDVTRRCVYIMYSLNEQGYIRYLNIGEIISYLIKVYKKELNNAPAIIIFDQLEEENGEIKRYVGIDYPIQQIRNKKEVTYIL